MKQVLDAIDFARTAHQGQFDRGGRPYFEHVERVCIRTCSRLFELDPRGDKIDNQVFLDVAAAAALHDVVEDCDIGGDDLLAAGFTQGTIRRVLRLSGRAQALSYLDNIRAMVTDGDFGVMLIKICDNEDNSAPERIMALPPEQRDIVRRYERSLSILRPALARCFP
jgi:(p)ppGpp synthase/HD superfamily hydrolase